MLEFTPFLFLFAVFCLLYPKLCCFFDPKNKLDCGLLQVYVVDGLRLIAQ